jgi:hypothetical protein
MNQELLDRCRSILELVNERPITPNQKYTHETIIGIVKLADQYAGWRELFHRAPAGIHPTEHYDCDIKCNKCEKVYQKFLTKTQFISYVGDIGGRVKNTERKKAFMDVSTCDECKAGEREASKVRISEFHEKRAQEIAEAQEKAKRIMPPFFVPYNVPGKKTNWNEVYELFWSYIPYYFNEEIESLLKEMSYKEFLHTPYWKCVSSKVKRQARYQCVMCDGKTQLQTHHKNYNFRGKEHTREGLNSLVCICADCHSKHHEIES